MDANALDRVGGGGINFVVFDVVALLLALFREALRLLRANVDFGILDLGLIRRGVVKIVLDNHQLRVHLLDLGGESAHATIVNFANFQVNRFTRSQWCRQRNGQILGDDQIDIIGLCCQKYQLSSAQNGISRKLNRADEVAARVGDLYRD